MAMKSTGGEAFVMSARLAEISESVTAAGLGRTPANAALFPGSCSSQGAQICRNSLISALPSKGC